MGAGKGVDVTTTAEDSAHRSWTMRQVRSINTKPELRVRRALHAAGFRFRLHRKDLPGHPDIVLPRFQTVVFVNGCQWHWHGCKRSRMPATNRDYWTKKIERNVARDAENCRLLREQGWTVAIIWECQLDSDTERLIEELRRKRSQTSSSSSS